MRAPPLVLIPGLMCDEAVWSAQIGALRTLGIDCRVAHHGRADSLVAMARAVLESVPGPMAVAGHSMGGRVALEIVRLAGARLRGIALLDTGYRALAAGEAGERERAGRLRLLEQARTEGVRAMARNWLQGMVHPSRLQDAPLVESIVSMFERRSIEEFAAQIQALLMRPDATPVLPQIAAPALLLCGEQDAWSPPAQHREMERLIPGSRFIAVPDCGHMSPIERPGAVNSALRGWLERLAPREQRGA
jgi:pimeloyl-ACP methyl ester carboxylesterase